MTDLQTQQIRDRMADHLADLPGVTAVGQWGPGAMGDRVTLYFEELPLSVDPGQDLGVNAAVWIASITEDPSARFDYGVTVEVHRYPPDW